MIFLEKNTDSFEKLLNNNPIFQSRSKQSYYEGTIVRIDRNIVYIDIGFKTVVKFTEDEIKAIAPIVHKDNLYSGDISVGKKVYLSVWNEETMEGEILANPYSYFKGIYELRTWDYIAREEYVRGVILNSVNGGFSVGISGLVAFLPKSLAKLPKVGKEDHIRKLMENYHEYKVVSINSYNKNVVVALWSKSIST